MHNELDYELVAVVTTRVAIVLLDIRLHILCNIHDSGEVFQGCAKLIDFDWIFDFGCENFRNFRF